MFLCSQAQLLVGGGEQQRRVALWGRRRRTDGHQGAAQVSHNVPPHLPACQRSRLQTHTVLRPRVVPAAQL